MKGGFLRISLAFSLAFSIVPAEAAIFNDIQPGARAMGMGYAYGAISDDVYGMFFNPAGLAGAPFAQISGGIQRIPSNVGILSQETFVYSRPFPILPGSTVGAGFTDLKQRNVGGKGQFLTHFSTTLDLKKYFIPKPVKVGANFKISAVDPKDKPNVVALGFDLGAMIEPGWNMTYGLSITDLSTNVGVPTPTVTAAVAYRYKRRIHFALDLRMRSGLTALYPGIEVDFLSRLLKVRAGRGVSLDFQDTLALGVGINYSPLFLDFAVTLPAKGRTHSGTGVQVSTTWKFGAPPFYGRFPGEAARTAEDMRGDVADLKRQVKDLRRIRDAADANKTSLEGQVNAEEERLRDLQQQSRDLEYDLQRRRYDRDHDEPGDPLLSTPDAQEEDPFANFPASIDSSSVPSPSPTLSPTPKKTRKRRIRKRSRFPKRHRVKAGDTLRKLADKYYGNPALWEAIYEANPDRIERGLPIEGKTLIIPKPDKR
ncbi:MAG: hypothetical protein COB53_02165 [Elusimicrobia bacterium]|nr:MAG: hypothetical protein COB53_02165 [Elusimicrobiota bacterium]